MVQPGLQTLPVAAEEVVEAEAADAPLTAAVIPGPVEIVPAQPQLPEQPVGAASTTDIITEVCRWFCYSFRPPPPRLQVQGS